jgi:holliday junction DNA helicase RuvB
MVNTLIQALSSIWQKSFFEERHSFNDIIGHNDIKKIFLKTLLSKRPIHILLVGSPGCAKTMFLTEIVRTVKQSYFIVGSNTTKAGLINQLFEKKPRYLLIDELEKMSNVDQVSLLHLMETGIISETKIKKTRQLQLTSWVFATANSTDKINEPLLSRFVILQVQEYSFEEFTNIAISRLAKEKVNRDMATVIAEKVWTVLDSRDIRDVVKVARLVNDQEDIHHIIGIMKRYSGRYNNRIQNSKQSNLISNY